MIKKGLNNTASSKPRNKRNSERIEQTTTAKSKKNIYSDTFNEELESSNYSQKQENFNADDNKSESHSRSNSHINNKPNNNINNNSLKNKINFSAQENIFNIDIDEKCQKYNIFDKDHLRDYNSQEHFLNSAEKWRHSRKPNDLDDNFSEFPNYIRLKHDSSEKLFNITGSHANTFNKENELKNLNLISNHVTMNIKTEINPNSGNNGKENNIYFEDKTLNKSNNDSNTININNSDNNNNNKNNADFNCNYNYNSSQSLFQNIFTIEDSNINYNCENNNNKIYNKEDNFGSFAEAKIPAISSVDFIEYSNFNEAQQISNRNSLECNQIKCEYNNNPKGFIFPNTNLYANDFNFNFLTGEVNKTNSIIFSSAAEAKQKNDTIINKCGNIILNGDENENYNGYEINPTNTRRIFGVSQEPLVLNTQMIIESKIFF